MHTDSPSRDLVNAWKDKEQDHWVLCCNGSDLRSNLHLQRNLLLASLCPQRYTTLKTAFSAKDSNVGTEPLMPSMRSRMHARREDMHETLT